MEGLVQQESAFVFPDSQPARPRMSKRAELFVAEALQGAISEGKGFIVNVGAFSTPITGGGAGTVIDIDQPELAIGVPTGKTIFIFSAKVQCHVPLLAADANEAEILLAVDKDTTLAADGTATTETPVNLKMQSAEVSACTVKSAFTADVTDPTLDIELDREAITGDVQGTAACALWTPLKLDYEPRVMAELVGPCAVYLYWGGTVATPGYAQVCWVERPS